MGTRSFIAMEDGGKYKGIYCHWDGYLSNNGKILLEHYKDVAKVRILISMGDMSSLKPEIGTKHSFDAKSDDCTFYGRDRGETGIETTVKSSVTDLQKHGSEMGAEYFYLFKDNTWFVASRGSQFFGMSDGSPLSSLVPLAEAIAEEEKEEAANVE